VKKIIINMKTIIRCMLTFPTACCHGAIVSVSLSHETTPL
jgi:hypothetical protein